MPRFVKEESTLVGELPARSIPRPRPRPPSLELIRGPGAPKVFHLEQRELLVGRGAHADLVIDSAALSREHLRLTQTDGEVTFVDLDSANGVYLNGVLAHAAVLRDGDLLEFGEAVCRFYEGGL